MLSQSHEMSTAVPDTGSYNNKTIYVLPHYLFHTKPIRAFSMLFISFNHGKLENTAKFMDDVMGAQQWNQTADV